MSDLLSFAVSAHGGLDRWHTFQTIEARMAVGGGIFAAKRNPGLQNDVTYRIQTHEERVAIDRFSAPDRRVNIVPSRLTLETLSGDLIEARDDPRSAFAGQTEESPWDSLHVAYFTSYALWTYLNLPFLYTWPGFVTEDVGPWHENGEEWRRLKATFPETVASHSVEQIISAPMASCEGTTIPSTSSVVHPERITRQTIKTSKAYRYRQLGEFTRMT